MITSSAGARHARAWALLGAAVAAYIALYISYYPKFFAIEDEVGFVNQAFVWSKGAISAEGAGLKSYDEFQEIKGRHVEWRNPGRSLFALPFIFLGGVAGLFASSLLIHLLIVAGAGLLLLRLDCSPLWALLLLLHPTLALYSRTVMADELAGMLLLLAVLISISSRPTQGIPAGLAVGFAVAARYQAAVTVPFFIWALWQASGKRVVAGFVLSCAAVGAAIVTYNICVLNSVVGWYTAHGNFRMENIPANAPFYFAALLLIYPGMLAAPFFDRSIARPFTFAVCGSMLVMLCAYYFYDKGATWPETLVLGQRLLQPALPLLICSYAVVGEKRVLPWLRKRVPGGVLAAVLSVSGVLLFAGVAMMFKRHQAYLEDQRALARDIQEQLPENSLVISNRRVSKLFGVAICNPPKYRWRTYSYLDAPKDYSAELKNEKDAWYLALLIKTSGEELPATLQKYIADYNMQRVPIERPGLILYKSR